MFCKEFKYQPPWSSSPASPPGSELCSQLPPSSAAHSGASAALLETFAWKLTAILTERGDTD